MANLIKVIRRPNEDINKLIKRWKKKFDEAEIKEELVSRQEFVKPSLQRRKQKQEAVRNNQREVTLKKLEDGKL
jgi:small subunit ribosomal protein S21